LKYFSRVAWDQFDILKNYEYGESGTYELKDFLGSTNTGVKVVRVLVLLREVS